MATPGATGRQRPPLAEKKIHEEQKRAAARAAAALVEDGMRVGLGTGSTVAHLLPAIVERGLRELRCAATSPATAKAATKLGLAVESLDALGELDLAIDGADQIDLHGWLIKGGGGAHTREKIIAGASRRFVVIASAEKAVETLRPPLPLELLKFGVQRTLLTLAPAQLRDAPKSPDGGLIADYLGEIDDPRTLAARLSATPGLIEHGLFQPELIDTILIASSDGVQLRTGGKPSAL